MPRIAPHNQLKALRDPKLLKHKLSEVLGAIRAYAELHAPLRELIEQGEGTGVELGVCEGEINTQLPKSLYRPLKLLTLKGTERLSELR
jgi:hypothetical protein